jgi:hypothetical protein
MKGSSMLAVASRICLGDSVSQAFFAVQRHLLTRAGAMCDLSLGASSVTDKLQAFRNLELYMKTVQVFLQTQLGDALSAISFGIKDCLNIECLTARDAAEAADNLKKILEVVSCESTNPVNSDVRDPLA